MPRSFYRASLIFFSYSLSLRSRRTPARFAARSAIPSGRRIVDASIALVDSAQGFTYFVTSDAEGKFVFEFLPPGDYLARAVAPDMSPQITPSLHVNAGGTTQLEFTLQVGGAKEMVTVSGDPPLGRNSIQRRLFDGRQTRD